MSPRSARALPRRLPWVNPPRSGRWALGLTANRELADWRGKVVVLYFWGISFWQSVGALPALGKLATEFQPRGVDVLAIHNAELDEEHAREQGRKVLAFKGVAIGPGD